MKYMIHYQLLFEMFTALDIHSQDLDEYQEVVHLNKHAIGPLSGWLRNNISFIINEKWNDMTGSFRFTTLSGETKTIDITSMIMSTDLKTKTILRLFLMELIDDKKEERFQLPHDFDPIIATISGC